MYLSRSIRKTKALTLRSIFGALNVIFNKVNEERVKEVGPDRACAEWLMRNGAFIRWKGESNLVKLYNDLPLDPEQKGDYQIEEIAAHGASISHHGFQHFHGCQHVRTISFLKCPFLDDNCLRKLDILTDSLNNLQITNCDEIEEGLKYLGALKNLQMLNLCNLQGIRELDKQIEKLKGDLPNCKILYCQN